MLNGAGVLGDMALGDAISPARTLTMPSVGSVLGGRGVELAPVLDFGGSANEIIVPPYPLDCEFGESTDGRFARPPQLRRTL